MRDWQETTATATGFAMHANLRNQAIEVGNCRSEAARRELGSGRNDGRRRLESEGIGGEEMPWVVWPVVALFVSLWLPVIGKRIALAFRTASTAVTSGVPTLVAQLIHGAPDISGPLEVVHRGRSAPGRLRAGPRARRLDGRRVAGGRAGARRRGLRCDAAPGQTRQVSSTR